MFGIWLSVQHYACGCRPLVMSTHRDTLVELSTRGALRRRGRNHHYIAQYVGIDNYITEDGKYREWVSTDGLGGYVWADGSVEIRRDGGGDADKFDRHRHGELPTQGQFEAVGYPPLTDEDFAIETVHLPDCENWAAVVIAPAAALRDGPGKARGRINWGVLRSA